MKEDKRDYEWERNGLVQSLKGYTNDVWDRLLLRIRFKSDGAI